MLSGAGNYSIPEGFKDAEFGYKDFIPKFKAEKFSADEWLSLFEEAGAKYGVPVAEHHDGLSLYNSARNKWNSVDMGPVPGSLLLKEKPSEFAHSLKIVIEWEERFIV